MAPGGGITRGTRMRRRVSRPDREDAIPLYGHLATTRPVTSHRDVAMSTSDLDNPAATEVRGVAAAVLPDAAGTIRIPKQPYGGTFTPAPDNAPERVIAAVRPTAVKQRAGPGVTPASWGETPLG